MRHLWENSHLKHNNSNEEHFFIMFLTLKAMQGHFWEQCQVGLSHKSGECVREKNGCGSCTVKRSQCTWNGSAHFTATAYSSVPSNGGKQVMITKQTPQLDWSDSWSVFPNCVWALRKCRLSLWHHFLCPQVPKPVSWVDLQLNSEIAGTSNH